MFELEEGGFEFEIVDGISQGFQSRLLDHSCHRRANSAKGLAGVSVVAFQKGLQTEDGVPGIGPIKRAGWWFVDFGHWTVQRLLNGVDLSRQHGGELMEQWRKRGGCGLLMQRPLQTLGCGMYGGDADIASNACYGMGDAFGEFAISVLECG